VVVAPASVLGWDATGMVARTAPLAALTTAERHKAVRVLYNRHFRGGRGPHAKWDAGWSLERIGQEMGYSANTVDNIVHPVCPPKKGPEPQPGDPPTDVQSIVQQAPPQYRADLAETAREQHWSPQEAQVAVHGLHDPALPEHMKEEMAQGLFPPCNTALAGSTR
jgi:hypothetical protein